jgi:hypothetical protein
VVESANLHRSSEHALDPNQPRLRKPQLSTHAHDAIRKSAEPPLQNDLIRESLTSSLCRIKTKARPRSSKIYGMGPPLSLEIEDERDREKDQEVEKDRDIDRDSGLSH